MKTKKWIRLDKDEIPDIFEQLKLDIENAKIMRADDEIKFYVGTDSQRKKKYITYVTAIVMYTEKKGGAVYYTKERESVLDMHSRLWNETYKAVNIAQELNEFLKDFNLRVHEVHADLNANPKYKSHKLVKSCLGYIQGMGFDGMIKPDAWAASKIANKHTK